VSGPLYLPIAALALIVLAILLFGRLYLRHHRETQRRYREGRCLNCGYDLRANPQGRCPECGRFL
jgi:hypothetical protein